MAHTETGLHNRNEFRARMNSVIEHPKAPAHVKTKAQAALDNLHKLDMCDRLLELIHQPPAVAMAHDRVAYWDRRLGR